MFIRIVDQEESIDINIKPGDNLMSLLRQENKPLNAPCGGRGTCGKCLVEIDGAGPVLACQTVIGRDLPLPDSLVATEPATAEPIAVVRLPRRSETLILIDGLAGDRLLQPLVQQYEAVIPPPTLQNQQADEERFSQTTGFSVPFALLGGLPAILAAADGKVRFSGRSDNKQVLRFLSVNSSRDVSGPVNTDGQEKILGVAIDIGTTTLAAYLYDLSNGRRLASAALANPQNAFGADVISRIARASSSDADREEMQRLILNAISSLIKTLYFRAGQEEAAKDKTTQTQTEADNAVDCSLTASLTGITGAWNPEDLTLLILAGNTTMMHLLAGIPAENIARAPFNPVTVKSRILAAPELGLTKFPRTLTVLLPSVASYVGADITAGVIALGLEKSKHDNALLIDIGTNGELVLRTADRLTACATAAGPAFEGANISDGMSGIGGAIDHVWITDADIEYSVISESENGARPVGICGSGLIDLAAVMLTSGVIDETGRIGADPEVLTPALRQRLTEVDGKPAFLVADSNETEHGRAIYLTQKDIRELQNAKGAIAAGIQLLLKRESTSAADIKIIYLAGGFGQYLNVANARAIGLLPAELSGRVIAAGNTSAMGAISALLDSSKLAAADAAAGRVHYLELSSDPEFSDLFIDALMFPEQ